MAATHETLAIRQRGPGVAQVAMSRPVVFNAFDETMIAELDAAFAALEADPEVRLIVLAGEGRHFSAGADLHRMQRASEAPVEWNLQDARRCAVSKARFCILPAVIGPYVRNAVGKRQAHQLALTAGRVRGTDEAREGFAAFLAKRPANWIPR